MSISQPPPARVTVLLAKNAPKAVIIIRKRAKLFHIVRWNYEKNELEQGSWFNGNIYVDRCDVSFDGRYMVYFALGPSKGMFSWTAICEPPFLKALMLWEQNDTWSGGGVFLDEKTLWLDLGEGPVVQNKSRYEPAKNIEKLYKLVYRGAQRHYKSPYQQRLERDGWVGTKSPDNKAGYEKWSRDKRYKLLLSSHGQHEFENVRYSLYRSSTDSYLEEIVDMETEWAKWDVLGGLIVEKHGVVSRYAFEDQQNLVLISSIDCSRFEQQ